MSDNEVVTIVLNVVLCGTSGFGIVKLGSPSDHPFAFAACVIGFCHGVLGLINTFVDKHNVRKIHKASSEIMGLIPLPLVNVELFLAADSNNIALAHGVFLIPLAISVLLDKIRDENIFDDVGGTVDTLKILTVLGNITSLIFLAINESSWKLGGMALLAFLAKFGADYSEEKIADNSRMPVRYLSWSAFYILAALTVTGEK